MKQLLPYIMFSLDERQYALRLSSVERIVRMVAITPLPKAPEIVLGVINVRGLVVPVFNIRLRFQLSQREIALDDQLIIANTGRRTVALAVDSVQGVSEFAQQDLAAAEQMLPGLEYIEGVLKQEDGLVIIHDIAKFLSLEEEKRLDFALT